MCGIIVAVEQRQKVDVPLFEKMRDQLYHRGPDYGGLWTDASGAVAFGHRRLAILDTSEAGNQPMIGGEGRYVITFNGEIYNFIELRESLEGMGRTFHTGSDTEVLLEALITWGEDALPKLNGMFAFAFWDNQQRTLLVVRDRFGEKPLFYAKPEDGGILLASEMKALLPDPRISNSVNEEVLQSYMNGGYYESEGHTFFKDIQRFPAATAMRFDETGELKRAWRYWVPDYENVNRDITFPEAEKRFGELFRKSVEMRLRSDVNVGSSLSGGLDSSAIVGLIHQSLSAGGARGGQGTFSARFEEDPTISEGPFIDEVVNRIGIPGYSIEPDPESLIKESAALHWHQEEPFLSASIYLQWCVARLAAENNTTVLLDGQGADEALGGYQFYFQTRQLDLLDEKRVIRLFMETYKFTSRLRKTASGYADSKRRFNDNIAFSIPSLFERLFKTNPPGGVDEPVGIPTQRPGGRVRHQMAQAVQYNCLPQLLRYADRNSMAFSRESRLPFLDYDLIDFCISLPDDFFFSDGWQKYILREATDGYVPDSIRWRADKVGYAAPLDIWMRGVMKDWSEARVFEGKVRDVPGYDEKNLRALWDAHQNSEANNSWALWRIISLNEWLDLNASGSFAENRQSLT
jgi:asparagine synthase (glutamine-hydrolysing)